MFRNLRDVPKVEGLKRDDGWVDMQVQFLIDKKTAGADHVVGWTVLKPGARHENHRHHNCGEFFIVLKGRGTIYTDTGETRSGRNVEAPSNLEANIGLITDLVRYVANILGAFGEALRPGDLLITGSVTPPLFLDHDERDVSFTLDPVGSVSARFARS